eukprot:Ihof_evm18s21 gene=Ihof_evmTU18s21
MDLSAVYTENCYGVISGELRKHLELVVWQELTPALQNMGILELRAKCLSRKIDPSGSSKMLQQRIVNHVTRQYLTATLATHKKTINSSLPQGTTCNHMSIYTCTNCIKYGVDTCTKPISISDIMPHLTTYHPLDILSNSIKKRTIISTWQPAQLVAPTIANNGTSGWAALPANILQIIMKFIPGGVCGVIFSQKIPSSVLRLAVKLSTCDPDPIDHHYYLPNDIDTQDCVSFYDNSESDMDDNEWEDTSDNSSFEEHNLDSKLNYSHNHNRMSPCNNIDRCIGVGVEGDDYEGVMVMKERIEDYTKSYIYGGIVFGPQTDVGLVLELCKMCPNLIEINLTGLLPASLFHTIGDSQKHLQKIRCSFSHANSDHFNAVLRGCSELRELIFE